MKWYWVEELLAGQRKSTHGLKFTEENLCAQQGYHLAAGIDEVGRGCLAGPVVAAAVIMPCDKHPVWYSQIRDSKLLTPQQREYLSPYIHEYAISIGTGVVDAYLIDNLGMTAAVRLAMRLAIEKLLPQPDYILIDYLTIPGLALPQKGVENGDTLCFSIASASIVAKVFRDHMMMELDKKYPGYGLAHHKGYGTEEHMNCLRKLGPSPLHRRLFQPVKNIAQISFDDLQMTIQGSEQSGA
jgi:ribonuclease HII